MAVIESRIVENTLQADGRRSVQEQHTDHLGRVHSINHTIPGDADAEKMMLDNVARIDSLLVEKEVRQSVESVVHGKSLSKFEFAQQSDVDLALLETKELYMREMNEIAKAVANLDGEIKRV